MIVSARAFTVRTVKYGDSRQIVTCYTDTEGMRGFMVRSGKSVPPSLFFPLSRIEFSYDNRSDMPYMRSVQVYPYRRLHSDMRKNAMAFFMAEAMAKCVTQPVAETEFFERLWKGFEALDTKDDGFADFHLFFLLELTALLGVYPCGETDSDFLRGNIETSLNRLVQLHAKSPSGYAFGNGLFTRQERQGLVKGLSAYCRSQAGVQGEFKSIEILEEVFR